MKGIIAAALGAAMLCGCVATNVPPPDRRVTIAEDLGTSVCITDIRCTKGASDFFTFQANMVNTTSREIAVDWKVVWLDADGVAIDSAVPDYQDKLLAWAGKRLHFSRPPATGGAQQSS